MFENMMEVFRKVIALAEEKHKYEEMYGFKDGSLKSFHEYQKTEDYKLYKEKEKALEEYLLKLDFEQIKILQTIMYLGRDHNYNQNDTPEQIYKEEREYMDSLGWEDKWREVNKIMEKAPLDMYLKNGLKILKIKY